MKDYHPIIKKILKRQSKKSKSEMENSATALGLYRASSVGYCGRQQQYAALGYQAETLTPEFQIGIFGDGNMHHHEVRRLLSEVGTLTHVEQQLSKKYKHKGEIFTVTGHIDGCWNDILFDIKSMNTFMYKVLNKNFPDSYMHYIYQLTLYMDMLKKKEAVFIFKDKNNGELRIIEMEFDPALLVQALDRIYEVHVGIKKNIKLPKEKHKLMERPYNATAWQCKSCVFRLHCRQQPMESKHWS